MGIDINRLGPDARRQIAAKAAVSFVQEQKRRKYGNAKESRGAITFDSRKEARRYDELMLLLKAGKIRGLKLQPQFTLQESYITPEGERVRAIRYIADFEYEKFVRVRGWEENGKIVFSTIDGMNWKRVVEDVKSTATQTAQYKLKRKLFREKYGFDITEV